MKFLHYNLLLTVLISALFLLSGCRDELVDDSFDNKEPEVSTSMEAPCINGMAAGFPCNNYDLISRISLKVFDAESASDVWGWTDPDTQNEYALIGLDNGTGFVDISTPSKPLYLGKLPTATINSSWRDIKIYSHYAYIVSDRAQNYGMQIFDLTKLKTVENPPVLFEVDVHHTSFGSAHNLVINETKGYVYPVGTSQYNGGPHFINIQNPLNPVDEGGFAASGYSHDGQVVTYNGPDEEHTGKELFVGSNEDKIAVVDITDKANPELISSVSYPNYGYTHQAWFGKNHRYLYVGDELDERDSGYKTRTLVFDLLDLGNPSLHMEYLGPTSAIDHNGYVHEDTFYLANYTSGVRMIDVSDIAAKNMTEIGYFDTYPANDDVGFNGVWSVYPYFESGNIVVSDINSCLYIIKKK
ncbi:MAG: choice-of-anchor B family protein [Flavobacteriaceae bacterium]|nr:choice-of-anchor B family protein [Flavobacteriaceae bacterium]MDG2314365.1 choice-of-anchor B family protein [Flavobacteriaceae bacterium]